ELDKQLKPLREELAAIRKPSEQKLLGKKLLDVPEPLRADTKAALNTPAEKRSELEKYLVRKLGAMLAVSAADAEAALSAEDQAKYHAIQDQIRPLEARKQSYGQVEALYDVGPPPPSYFLRRGNHETPIVEVKPGVLSVLTPEGQSPIIAGSDAQGQTSG